MRMLLRFAWCVLLGAGLAGTEVAAQSGSSVPTVPITDGVAEEFRIAFAPFMANNPVELDRGTQLVDVVRGDLIGTGLFEAVGGDADIEEISDFSLRPRFQDWRNLNAQWLVTGETAQEPDGRLAVRFRLWDVFSNRQEAGLQYFGPPSSWRRIAHRVADAIYSTVTGEDGYFDSRIAFVEETGPKNARRKRLALMDQDGANVRYLTGTGRLAMTPRFSPSRQEIAYISFASERAEIYVASIDTGEREFLGDFSGMSFAPRFSPDGRQLLMSMEDNGNTDVYLLNLATREQTRLTRHTAIDTAPCFSPDGKHIAFESDRSGTQQIYVMNADGSGSPRRISFDQDGEKRGRYATPVWSPRGDLIAFTKQTQGQFHIGLMTPEGTHERLLTSGYHNEGPTWSPNGRVLMFFREFSGPDKLPELYRVDVSGRKLHRVRTPAGASDPAWSPLLD